MDDTDRDGDSDDSDVVDSAEAGSGLQQLMFHMESYLDQSQKRGEKASSKELKKLRKCLNLLNSNKERYKMRLRRSTKRPKLKHEKGQETPVPKSIMAEEANNSDRHTTTEKKKKKKKMGRDSDAKPVTSNDSQAAISQTDVSMMALDAFPVVPFVAEDKKDAKANMDSTEGPSTQAPQPHATDAAAAITHAVPQNGKGSKAKKRSRVQRPPLITHRQALAVIANFRNQELYVYNEKDDAGLHHISDEPKDKGRFYQTACYEDGTAWGFDQREEPTEGRKKEEEGENCKRFRLPDLFQKQHTRILHEDLSKRRFPNNKLILEVYKLAFGHHQTELHHMKALYGILYTNTFHLRQSCLPGFPKNPRDGKCKSITQWFQIQRVRVKGIKKQVRQKQTLRALGKKTMKDVLMDYDLDLNQFGCICDWCKQKVNSSNMEKRAENEKDHSTGDSLVISPSDISTTTVANTKVEGKGTQSEWCNGGLSSTKILYECGFMHWRNLVTDAALQETFQDTESIDQFRITFAREMHFPSFKQDPENANENRLWQAALSLQDKKFKVKLWGVSHGSKIGNRTGFWQHAYENRN